MADNKFCADYAKRGTAACKKCKQKMEKGSLRLGKVVPNPFNDSGDDMKQWYHVSCLFETFVKARATTKKIEDPSDIDGWSDLTQEDQDLVLKNINDYLENANKKGSAKSPVAKVKAPASAKKQAKKPDVEKVAVTVKPRPVAESKNSCQDDSFKTFRNLCAKIAAEASYNAKTGIVSEFFTNGSDGEGFNGDLYIWVKSLIPNFVKRVYNLQSKQLVNLFSQIFGADLEDMVTDLENGDVASTVYTYFMQSKKLKPSAKSSLTLKDVDEYLEELTQVTKEEDQIGVLSQIAKSCTASDLQMVIRLIKRDLRINAGAKHILEGVHPDAYDAFQVSRNLRDVIDRVIEKQQNKPGMSKVLSVRANLMTPVLPMLAEACKSVEQAMKKCQNGMYAEIKYDGERVQVHKKGNHFSYFSRSLKPVLPHKVEHFKKYIPQAFPHGMDLILDSEVLLVDINTGTPLPFGTLGVHKKAAFKDASVCLFVFDCIHYNGKNLLDRPLKERRKFLQDNMVEVPNRIKFSEMKFITTPESLSGMIMEVLRKGLEGLVLKDAMSLYEPGKRHWLKVKKDYLAEGKMADLADLVVLGAFYGTGNKGGMMSSFVMGCYDTDSGKWCTVTKVSGGHDDKTLEKLQTELDMVKISKDQSKVPSWLNVTKSMVPDFISKNPKKSQVWEIVGAEFSKAQVHTANGISIRFPRVTRIRYDKTWKEATTLQELEVLVENSKEHINLPDLLSSSSGVSPKGKKRLQQSPEVSPQKPVKRKISEFDQDESDSPKKNQPTIQKFLPPAKKPKCDKNNEKRQVQEESESDDDILPNFFDGVKLYMPSTIPNFETWRRYVISYDGDMMDECDIAGATHIISQTKDSIPKLASKKAVCVKLQWLIDSVKMQKLLPCANYQIV